MGNLTYTTSGNIASFRSAAKVPVENFKCHFMPIQEGSGDPSSSNIRPIVGHTTCTAYRAGKNIAHFISYSAGTLDSPYRTAYTNGYYGQTLSTTDVSQPLTITQAQWPNTTNKHAYQNGYFCIQVDNLQFGQRYDFSFKVTNIVNNPLETPLSEIHIANPKGNSYSPTTINNDTIIIKNFLFDQNANRPQESDIAIYNCGMSCTFSDFMITPTGINDGIWEPYYGEITPITFPTIGKNLTSWFHPEGLTVSANYNGYTKWHDGWVPPSGADGLTITYSATIDNTNANSEAYLHIWTKDENDTYVDVYTISEKISAGNTGRLSKTMTINTNNYKTIYFGLTMTAGAVASNPMVEYGDTATTYEPYSSDNTIYGGYIDLIAGEVVEEWASIDLGDLTWLAKTTDGDYNYFYSTDIESKIDKPFMYQNYSTGTAWYVSAIKTLIADYSATDVGRNVATNNVILITTSGIRGRIVVRNDDLTDPADFKELVTGVQLVYKLASPVHHPIQKTAMKTLLDRNAFWSTSNDITEVSYYIHDSYMIQEAKKRALAEHKTHYRKVLWNQWAPPLAAGNWKPYSTRSTATFENGVATNEWLETYTGYVTSIRDDLGGTRQSDGEIWYASYMVKTSESDVQWGIEMCGGRQIRSIVKTDPNEWAQCSAVATYYRGTNNFLYICNISSASFVGLTAQVKSPILINLTAMFGRGHEPTKQHFEHLCKINGIDLTEYHQQDTGTLQYWWAPEGGTCDQTIVEWNQYCKPLIADNWQIYDSSYATVAFNDNVATRTDIQEITSLNYVYYNAVKTSYTITLNSSHLYYIKQEIYSSTPCNCVLVLGNKWAKTQAVEANTWTTVETITNPTVSTTYPYYLMYTNNLSEIDNTCSGKDPILIDLTQMFGAGNEPSTIAELKATCLKNGYNLDEAQKYNLGTKMIWKL